MFTSSTRVSSKSVQQLDVLCGASSGDKSGGATNFSLIYPNEISLFVKNCEKVVAPYGKLWHRKTHMPP